MSIAPALALALAVGAAVPVRSPPGTLHGFPSMSDLDGRVIADGELTQEVSGSRVVVRIRWLFADGRSVVEEDHFRSGESLVQERFTWVESRASAELRRFEVDFTNGASASSTHDDQGQPQRETEKLDLAAGRAFAGYGVALAVSELAVAPGGQEELTVVGFSPSPRAVTVQVRRDRSESVSVQNRRIPCDHFTLHPKIPSLIARIVGVKDGQLWFTHAAPRALIRARQPLLAKDDPEVYIDVTPRDAVRAPAAPTARAGRAARRR